MKVDLRFTEYLQICKVSQADFDNGKWDKMSDCLYKSDPKDLVKLDTVDLIIYRFGNFRKLNFLGQYYRMEDLSRR